MNNIELIDTTKISRLEVIDQSGGVLVKYLQPTEKILLSLQDEGRTLKIFIQTKEKV